MKKDKDATGVSIHVSMDANRPRERSSLPTVEAASSSVPRLAELSSSPHPGGGWERHLLVRTYQLLSEQQLLLQLSPNADKSSKCVPASFGQPRVLWAVLVPVRPERRVPADCSTHMEEAASAMLAT